MQKIHMRRFSIISIILIALLIATPLSGCTAKSDDSTPQRDWAMANCSYDNTRNTLASGINSQNVVTLGVSWSIDITGIGEWGGMASNPIILDDVVYCQDLKSNVYAISLNTGDLLWKKEYNLNSFGPNGPAIAGDRLFVNKGYYDVAALDLKTGDELWSTSISSVETTGIDIQLTAYNGMVYLSTVPGTSNSNFYTGGGIGTIYALDQSSGDIKWHFDTIDSADIWGNPEVNSGGGAWFPPAIDVDTDIMYWGIANPAPFPGTETFPNATSRPGPNLYTNTLVALDTSSGELLWYNQVKPHDLFDLDFQSSPVLASAEINGSATDVVIGTGKLGKVYAFDRASGDIYWQTPVGEHQNDELTELPADTTRVLPGPLGGVTSPIAVSNGTVYLSLVNIPGDYTPTGFVLETFDIGAGNGELVALDLNTGSEKWQVDFASVCFGGATIVNDLVFTSTLEGMIYALDADSGQEVWSYQAPGGINGWPAVTGDFIIFPIGLGEKPQLLAFELGMAESPADPDQETQANSGTDPETAPVVFNADGIVSPGEYAHSQAYDNYEMYWGNDDEYLYLAMRAETTGYVAFGVQPGHSMKDADIIIGLVSNGQVKILDTFSTGNYGPHPEDITLGGTDDIIEYGGQEEDGYTTIEFKRALDTNDTYDETLVSGANKIMWAYCLSDDPNVKHTARGTGEITIDES